VADKAIADMRQSSLFRLFMRRKVVKPNPKVLISGIDLGIREESYGDACRNATLHGLRYANLDQYDIIDLGQRKGWYRLFLTLDRINGKKVIILDDNMYAENYWGELPLLLRDTLGIRNISIPNIDYHEWYLKERMLKHMFEAAGVTKYYVYVGRHERPRTQCIGIIVEKGVS
jgi:hypothetical protein